jgi:hypothetical protein
MKIEVSNGEILDKFCILQIKKSKTNDVNKLTNINRELNELKKAYVEIGFDKSDHDKLLTINLKLWDVEDKLRELEKINKFDNVFIHLARRVYKLNDKRAVVKREVNTKTKSKLIEEKIYK